MLAGFKQSVWTFYMYPCFSFTIMCICVCVSVFVLMCISV